jgi:hypothetical protein
MKKLTFVLSLALFLPVLASAATRLDTTKCWLSSVSYLPALPARDTSDAMKLQRKGYHSEVGKWLSLAEKHKATGDVTPEICYALNVAKLGNWRIEEFGTSEPKLAMLQRDGYHSEAVMWIKHAVERSQRGDVTYSINQAKHFALLAGDNFNKLVKMYMPPAPALTRNRVPPR